jgi:hypothetical protein
MLTSFFALSEYWKYFYCGFEKSKVIEKFIIEKFKDTPLTSTSKRLIGPIPEELSKKSASFFQRLIQCSQGYKGWRFICTADESHMRSSINLVISEDTFGLIYDGEEDGPESFKGNYEFDFNIFTKLLVPSFVSLSQDIMALLNLALEKYLKSPLQQMRTFSITAPIFQVIEKRSCLTSATFQG